ncbi:hypothetical protein BGS_0295 [Beggiatoa sp. SS]|nr:hypothetical protein BGS_0295 [Beggiatoa sp. SS]
MTLPSKKAFFWDGTLIPKIWRKALSPVLFFRVWNVKKGEIMFAEWGSQNRIDSTKDTQNTVS